MINLMPKEQKTSIAYARRNSQMLRWVSMMIIAVVGLVVISAGSLFYIKQESKAYQQSIVDTEKDLKDQNEEKTLERVGEIGGRLSLVVNVLSREVLFSKLLPHLGSVIPDGAILQELSLSRETVGGIDLSIGAVDYETASQILVNLQASESLLFQGADVNNVVCEGTENPKYPCLVSIRAVLVKDNPFLLLNSEDNNE